MNINIKASLVSQRELEHKKGISNVDIVWCALHSDLLNDRFGLGRLQVSM